MMSQRSEDPFAALIRVNNDQTEKDENAQKCQPGQYKDFAMSVYV